MRSLHGYVCGFAIALAGACAPAAQPPIVIAPATSAPAIATSAPPHGRAHFGPDRDADGVADDVDRCPEEGEDYDGFMDDDGCPDPDNDRDGIRDVDDRCPNVAGPAPDGCPRAASGDRDADGIPDAKDKCPDDPEDRDGFQDEDGCPDPDNDHDGIPDTVDQCPNDAETFNGRNDADGCPD